VQYAPAIYAFGAKLAYNTKSGELDIAEYPDRKEAKNILDAALADIILFEDTSNFQDGLHIFALADFVDNKPNPVTKTSRMNILEQTGVMQEGRFVRQNLERAKVNKSWHISEVAGECSYFGDICTNRGVIDTSHRRGRKSERNPNQYHLRSSKGIGREQLVTPAVELLYDSIPSEQLTSAGKATPIVDISKIDISSIEPERLQELISQFEKEIKNRA